MIYLYSLVKNPFCIIPHIVPPFGLYIFLDDKDIFTYDNAAIHQINRERVVRRNWKMREGENQPASIVEHHITSRDVKEITIFA